MNGVCRDTDERNCPTRQFGSACHCRSVARVAELSTATCGYVDCL
ncbi:hypothetical protein DXT66_00865 [Nocardia farcinica]|nr:hypothetical protein DXT66_00865 [Nocardia farcinica]